jgi:DNA primase
MRARELFQQAGLSVRVAVLPEGADPDAVIRGRGVEVFQGLLAAAVPIVEWELGRVLARAEGKDEGERIEVLGKAVSALARVAAGVEREYYVRWLAQRWSADAPDRRMAMEAAIREELARRMTRGRERARRTYDRPGGGSAVTAHPGVGRPAASRVEAMVLAAFVQYGELAARYAPALEAEDFGGGEEREIFEVIQRLVESREAVAADAVLARLAPGAGQALAELALEEVPVERVEESVASGVKRLVEVRLRRREGELLRMLEKAATQEEREAIRGELSEVTSKRSELAGRRLVGEE